MTKSSGAQLDGPLITVLGVGNFILGDDGIGPAILAGLQKSRGDDSRIWFEDGGINGMQLLEVVQQSKHLLIVDAVATDREPGSVVRVSGDQVPRLLSSKLSPHQVGLLDVLTAAQLLDDEPEQIEVVGIVPARIWLNVGLSETAQAAIGPAVRLAEEVLDEWLAS